MADFPLLLVAQQCEERMEECKKQGLEMIIYQKWTCGNCGTRQTMDVPNQFYTSGKCEECKAITQIKMCNYLAALTSKGKKHANEN